jgi:hypothetical protein
MHHAFFGGGLRDPAMHFGEDANISLPAEFSLRERRGNLFPVLLHVGENVRDETPHTRTRRLGRVGQPAQPATRYRVPTNSRSSSDQVFR